MSWQQPAKSTQDADVEVQNPPSDTISCIACNGSRTQPTTMLVAGSWDASVSCYQVQSVNGKVSNIIPHAQIKHEAPVLCADVSSDQVTVFSAGCERTVKSWNVQQAQTQPTTIGTHDQPVRCLKYAPELSMLVTGGWDKIVKIWDTRSPTPAAQAELSDRVYAMDCRS